MKVFFPNSAFLGNIDPFLRQFDRSEPEKLEISSNRKWISVHPVALSMAASLGLTVDPSNIRSEPFEAKSRHYLERMGLFEMLGMDSDMVVKEHDPSGRFIPLTCVKEPEELTKFITDMIPMLHAEPDDARSIRYIVSELVRNVLEHSNSEHGAIICAQYYKKSNMIRIGIADTGIGIKASISRSHDAPTHLEALRLAMMPGITGATRREGGTEQNAGAGLFFIKSIAKVNRDFFLLYSGDALFKLLKNPPGVRMARLYADPFRDRFSSEEGLPFWNGTVVGIDLSLDVHREFSILLDQIRKTYVQTIRERKKARYRRPRFI